MRPPPLGDIPEGLRGLGVSFDAPELALLPFAHRCVVQSRPPPPRLPPAAPFPDGLCPQTEWDIFEPWFLEALSEFLRKYNAYHRARVRGEHAERPGVFAADETAAKPAYRYMFIDMRGGHGNIKPMDPNALACTPLFDPEALHAALVSV